MKNNKPSILNIAFVGGGEYCKAILEKSAQDFKKEEVNARIVAVVDQDTKAPGMVVAGNMGLETLQDFHDLYDPVRDINLITFLDPDPAVFKKILDTKPDHIRMLSYEAFDLFWKTIGVEERKLRERNQEVETILNSIDDFITVISPDMEILEVNDAFLRKMRYTEDEVIGKKCYEIFVKRSEPCISDGSVCPMDVAIRTQRSYQQLLTRVNRAGVLKYIEVTVFPIWEKEGKISKFIEVSRDVTKRKKEDQEVTNRLERMVEERTCQLKETHDKLLHKDKMASLGKLSASVVHEINNPITGILNLAMLMKRIIEEESIQMQEVDNFNKYLDLMETESRRISRIVSNLLTFSRHANMEFKKLNFNNLIEKMLVLNSNLIKINNVTVEQKLDLGLPELTGSEDQLQQVIMNFLSNSVEAMEASGGGKLTIETRYSAKNDKIVVCFSDSGIGIPEENLLKIFEPFLQQKRKEKVLDLVFQ